MKRHSMIAATVVAGTLSIALPASAGPLGAISGGASGGVLGTLGGTLSSPASTLGFGAGGVLGATGQFEGSIARPNLNVDPAPVRKATHAIDKAGDKAKSKTGDALERAESTKLPSLNPSAGGSASAEGGASAGPASANAEASAGANARATY